MMILVVIFLPVIAVSQALRVVLLIILVVIFVPGIVIPQALLVVFVRSATCSTSTSTRLTTSTCTIITSSIVLWAYQYLEQACLPL